MIFKLFIIITLSKIYDVSCNEVITRYEDTCNLSEKLKLEIASYKNITEKIVSDIKNVYGKDMYDRYTQFIDTFGARFSGTKVLEDSIDYMINLTKTMGINDVTTENVVGPHWIRSHEKLEMRLPYNKPMALLGLGYSVSTPPEGITAEVIVFKSFKELLATDESKVKGKIVVFDEPFISYGETVPYREFGASKAATKGAVAVLIRSITPVSLYTPHTGAMQYIDNITKIPAAAITHEDADLMNRLQESKKTIVLTLLMQNKMDLKASRNTIIDLKGKNKPEKQVIISGHIDSWDVGQGASDDGGGMWVSWFVPVILKKFGLQPRRTVRAILWTMEEMGLIGAISYYEKHKEQLNDINIIMESDEGTFKPLGLDVGCSFRARCILAEILNQLFPETNIMKNSGEPGSDITVFVKKGIPGASLLNQNDRYFWYHHTNADTLDIQTAKDVIDCAAFWAAISYVLADISEDIPRK